MDSSGWIEYFTAGPNSGFFAGAIEKVDELIVPALAIYEVFKWVSRERDETQALKAIAHMQLREVVDLDSKLAIYAARLSLQTKLPMADSIVYATARASEATLWTQDDDFEGLDDVKYIPKKKAAK
ncbi:MAG TPA: type II toxin-antitoxin system VapC family toxin [Candidatus Limnocylindrales bacterium]|nr:type II toxin-antitoxin system VapC family toxin [Candidatus Limnocylindrales bacterium]